MLRQPASAAQYLLILLLFYFYTVICYYYCSVVGGGGGARDREAVCVFHKISTCLLDRNIITTVRTWGLAKEATGVHRRGGGGALISVSYSEEMCKRQKHEIVFVYAYGCIRVCCLKMLW